MVTNARAGNAPPSPTRGAQIAAALRHPAAAAGHPGQRPGAHDAARSAREAPGGGQRLLGGRSQFICFADAPLGCPRPIQLKDARTCAAVGRSRLLGVVAQPSRQHGAAFKSDAFWRFVRAHPVLEHIRPGDQRRGRCRRERPSWPSAEVREGRQGFEVGPRAGRPEWAHDQPGSRVHLTTRGPVPPTVWRRRGSAAESLEDVHDDGCGPGAGGGGGIRTHERLAPLPVFKTGAMNRSATPPRVASVATSRAAGVVPASAI